MTALLRGCPMYSKLVALWLRRKLLLVLLLLGTALQMSCSEYRTPVSRPVPVLNMKGGCVGDLAPLAGGFFKGQSTDFQVREFWQCLDVTLYKFSQVTRGAESGLYRADEIKRFLQTYFVSPSVLTDGLFAEIMALKPILLGGASDYLTQSELVRLRQLMAEFSQISLSLLPHIRQMSQWRQMAQGQGRLPQLPAEEQALGDLLETFLAAAEQVGEALSRSGIAYPRDRLESLVIEIDRIKGTQWSRWLPLALRLKVLTVGGSESSVLAQEWRPLFSLLTRAFHTSFLAGLVTQAPSSSDPSALSLADLAVRAGFDLAEAVVSRQPNQVLAWGQVDSLLVEFENLDALPFSLTAPQALKLFQVLAERFLSPQSCSGSSESEGGITQGSLSRLKALYADWLWGQQSILSLLRGAPSDPEVHPRLRSLALGPIALAHDPQGRLRLWPRSLSSEPLAAYADKDLTQLNLLGFLAEEVIRAYSPVACSSQDLRDGAVMGLDKNQLEVVVGELHPLLAALGLVSFAEDDQQGLSRFVGKVFRDASLFMPRSNGDRQIDLFEAVEFLTFGFSGLNASRLVFSELEAVEHCLRRDPTGEVLGLDPVACLRPLLFARRDILLNHLSQLQAYLNEQDIAQWMRYERELELTVRPSGYSNQPVSVSELTEMMVMMKYIETFFFRFDRDSDGKINLAESLKAFPLFLPTLVDLFESIGVEAEEELVRAFFTFLFREGTTPFDDVEAFEEWMAKPELWAVSADRLIVAKILASLSELASSSMLGELRSVYEKFTGAKNESL